MEDLAQTGGDRPHLRPWSSLRESPGSRRPLVDLLAGEVDVGAVFEGHDHLGQAETVTRAHLLQTRQSAERLLDREGDLPLDLLGGQPRRRGVDLHLDRRGVRKGIDVDGADDVETATGENDGRQDDQEAMFERPFDDLVQHGAPLMILTSLAAARRRAGLRPAAKPEG